ncbi:SpoIIE family protein phosphatase [Persicobacter sp. CCB-QB2]|uniref:SpoIIE family protein phosphatase n=1 Tax=Persicobacter sp. CCB-QB2 TaxID=1561025 RepID=UPI0006A978C2|nr:SpoIIE family protein phosphatase [Persicobacter sp. CCB-QB2]
MIKKNNISFYTYFFLFSLFFHAQVLVYGQEVSNIKLYDYSQPWAKYEREVLKQLVYQDPKGFIHVIDEFSRPRRLQGKEWSVVHDFDFVGKVINHVFEENKMVIAHPDKIYWRDYGEDQPQIYDSLEIPQNFKPIYAKKLRQLAVQGDYFYFLSAEGLLMLNWKTKIWSMHELRSGFQVFKQKEGLFITDIFHGPYYVKENKVHLLEFLGKSFRLRYTPIGFVEVEKGKFMTFNRRGQIYNFDLEGNVELLNAYDQLTAEAGPNGAYLLNDGLIALKTDSEGLLFYTQQGEFVAKVNGENGLKTDFVRGFMQDREGNIWIVGNGVIQCWPYSSFLTQVMGQDNGFCIGASRYDSAIIYASDKGLFRFKQNDHNFMFHYDELKEIPARSKSIFSVGNHFFYSSFNFFYSDSGLDNLKQVNLRAYEGFRLFSYKGKQYLACFGAARIDIFDFEGEQKRLWYSNYENAFNPTDLEFVLEQGHPVFYFTTNENWGKIRLDSDWDTKNYKAFRLTDPMVSSSQDNKVLVPDVFTEHFLDYKIEYIDRDLKLIGDKKLYKRDDQLFMVVNDKQYALREDQWVFDQAVIQGEVLSKSTQDTYRLLHFENEKYVIQTFGEEEEHIKKVEVSLPDKVVGKVIDILDVEDGKKWIFSRKGVFFLDPNKSEQEYTLKIFPLRVESEEQKFKIQDWGSVPQLAYNKPLHVKAVAPYYQCPEALHYRYRIDDQSWSAWADDAEFTIYDMSPGGHSLEIQAKSSFSTDIEPLYIPFEVRLPWFLRWWAVLLYIVLLLSLLSMVVKWYTIKLRRQKIQLERRVKEHTLVLEQRNFELAQNRNELLKKSSLLTSLNKTLADRNSSIEASLNYADHVQRMFSLSEKEIEKIIPDYFHFSVAKDVLNGDFLWITHTAKGVIVAVADCTGHGVPAALLTMYGRQCLQEIVHARDIHQPALILEELQRKFTHTESGKQTELPDGMEIGVVLIQQDQALFAGANLDLIVVEEEELQVFRSDRLYIGTPLEQSSAQKFTQKEILLKENSTFYMVTDGFSDQFGKVSGKKLMRKNMRKLIFENSHLPLKAQGMVIQKFFEDWKGGEEQLDDATVVGFKPSSVILSKVVKQVHRLSGYVS